MSDAIRLNLGCGERLLPGYVNWDRKTGQEAYPLPLPAGSVDEVRASHILEHFPQGQTADVLREWVRVLKPGGVLRIAVPDFDWIVNEYQASKSQENGSHYPLMGFLFGGQVDDDDYHFNCFDYGGLALAFETFGLTDIGRWVSDAADCAALPVSLNIQGTKPLDAEITASEPITPGREVQVEIDPDTICAVMTQPRLGFSDHADSVFNTLTPFGMKRYTTGGAFWHQGMTQVIERALDELPDLEYILTLDYDSVFTYQDVGRLIWAMQQNPDVDALAAFQMKRGFDVPLMHTGDGDGDEVGGDGQSKWISIEVETLMAETMQVATAHFGLTLLRVSALKEVPKPWFLNVPDEDGSWGPGRMDADIYFWHNWKNAGKTVHIANRVPIGHLELTVSWPGSGLKKQRQAVEDWQKGGKPSNIWR